MSFKIIKSCFSQRIQMQSHAEAQRRKEKHVKKQKPLSDLNVQPLQGCVFFSLYPGFHPGLFIFDPFRVRCILILNKLHSHAGA